MNQSEVSPYHCNRNTSDMDSDSKLTSKILYIIFFLYVIALTTVCSFAQSAGVNELFQSETTYVTNELNIYPNPSAQNCNVILPEVFDYSNLKIEMYGMNGEVKHSYACYSISDCGFVIDLTNFINGTYSLQVVNGNKTYHQKMMVNK